MAEPRQVRSREEEGEVRRGFCRPRCVRTPLLMLQQHLGIFRAFHVGCQVSLRSRHTEGSCEGRVRRVGSVRHCPPCAWVSLPAFLCPVAGRGADLHTALRAKACPRVGRVRGSEMAPTVKQQGSCVYGQKGLLEPWALSVFTWAWSHDVC